MKKSAIKSLKDIDQKFIESTIKESYVRLRTCEKCGRLDMFIIPNIKQKDGSRKRTCQSCNIRSY